MKIKAVGFDIDGTLYPNGRMYVHSFPSFLRNPVLVYHYGKVRKQIREEQGKSEGFNFHSLQAELLAKEMNVTPEKARDIIQNQLYSPWEKTFKGIRPFNNMRETLEALKDQGFKLAALSDFPVQNKLRYLGLEGLWDAAFSSEDVGYLKPHTAPFLEMAKRLQLEPEEILYVGNSYKYDVLGAKNVGMLAAHLSKKPVENSIADFTFFSYNDLLKFAITIK